MAVTKVGLGKYTSDLLPHAVFESELEAKHYDRNAARQLAGGKDKLNGPFDPKPTELSQMHDLARAAMAEAADAIRSDEGGNIVEQFLDLTPEFINEGEQGAVNAGAISGYCKAQGILQPTVHDLRRAFEDLRALNALHLRKTK
jgi:DNA-binding transcriptional regulator YdaS (Cro superfamily)